MSIFFHKYQGAGNDFIMIDNRMNQIPSLSENIIKALCDRRFGIGANGLILLENHSDYDFKMIHYNSDGRKSTMCGNGGHCIVKFACHLGIQLEQYNFLAIGEEHKAFLKNGKVHLKMIDIGLPEKEGKGWFINTSSPHHVVFNPHVKNMKLVAEAQKIRYSNPYIAEGVNVNFVDSGEHGLVIRTYERGVEDETFSCGTGVTAAALTSYYTGRLKQKEIQVHTKGGNLAVTFEADEKGFKNVWLTGTVKFVFKGEIEI